MHKKHQNQSVWVGFMDVFRHEDGMEVGFRQILGLECVTVSYQTNCQPLEMYKEGAGKVDRVVVCLCCVELWMK